MRKYHILSASVLVAFIWIGVLYFTDIQDVSYVFPLLIFIDATSMSILMVGVTMFFEKQEGTIKALLVSPLDKAEYILAKTLANVSSNVLTLALLYLYARLFKEIHVNIVALLGAVILIAFFHALLGFLITYRSKGFTDLLMGMMKYLFVAMLPVVLTEVGLITSQWVSNLLYVLPTRASMILLQATTGLGTGRETALSLIYLLTLTGVLYVFVNKGFDAFAVKESGV